MNLNTDYLINLSGKISPLPWKLVGGWDESGDGEYFPAIDFDGDELVINVSHDHQKESIMANARLIAGAPELLSEVITLNKHNGVAQKTINRLSRELAETRAELSAAQARIAELEAAIESIRTDAENTPVGSEDIAKGSSVYNWYMAIYRKITDRLKDGTQ
jgi:hypothetical protein